MEQAVKNVGYIGLGNIGRPCAERLITDGFKAHVYDVYSPVVEDVAAMGAVGCASVAELARACEHVGICVRDDAQVEELLYDDDGLLANAAAGTTISVHSTVTQRNLLKWSVDAEKAGIVLLDAPITGGAHRAANGTLCYMVGGTAEQLAKVESIYRTSAEKVVHAGDLGAGIALKLCNNFMQYAEFVAMAEATRLADACGLSSDVLREVGLSNGVVNEQMHMFISGRNGMAVGASEQEMEDIFGALGRLAEKDLSCALSTASEHEVELPTARFLRERIYDVFLAKDESRPVAKR